MKFFNEFKEFAVKGNMIDMAIGIIIGAAFSKVVDVLVKKVLLPPLSLLSGNGILSNKKIILRETSKSETGSIIDEVAIGYGEFIEVFIDFFIIAFTIFLVIKFMNRLRKKSEDSKDVTVVTPKDIELLSKLTELMEEQNKILEKQS
ncbi:MAG: large conductance mechanosensitive channel protein MscL [Flavobacteriaceae bacterium]|nr:large conductance mechanosensitive channel protein MscL [Bacteroidia bacterium]NNK81707.1 large conductance mechanosensitive channel protein MscL [Flavobacteriaceae bacterium]